MVLLRIPTDVQPMTGIEEFKYQISDGKESLIYTLFVRDFAATLILQFLVHLAEKTGELHRLEITLALIRAS